MKTRRITAAVLGLMLGLGMASARADDPAMDQVDNPLFKAWSKFEPGASVTFEGDVDTPDGKIHITGTHTLKEKTADAAKIESVTQAGERKEDPKTQNVPAKLDAAAAKKTGDEDVKALDKTFKCQIYEITLAAVGADDDMKETKLTVDVSDEVPGGIVKAVMHTPDGKDVTFMVTSMKTK